MSKRNRRHGGKPPERRPLLSAADFAAIEARMLAHYGVAAKKTADGWVFDLETQPFVMPTFKPGRILAAIDPARSPDFTVSTMTVTQEGPPITVSLIDQMIREHRERLPEPYQFQDPPSRLDPYTIRGEF